MRSEIQYESLFCHQGVYDLIDNSGKEKFVDWSITELEKAIITKDSIPFIHGLEEYSALYEMLNSFYNKLPYLQSGESGQHYAYELFLEPPPHWSSRGAPLFWCYTARQFTYDKLPMTENEFADKYMSIVRKFNIPFGKDEYVYIEQFAAGGMSSGMVGGIFVKDGLELLLEQLSKYNN